MQAWDPIVKKETNIPIAISDFKRKDYDLSDSDIAKKRKTFVKPILLSSNMRIIHLIWRLLAD